MTKEENPTVNEKLPREQKVPLKGLYLSHNLKELAKKIKRPLVISNYVTDKNDVIATKDEEGNFQVAKEIKNSHDWRLFQELSAQADILITGSNYFQRFAEKGDEAQNILTEFEEGGSFEELGKWRLNNGYKKRSPDIAVVSRSLDFSIPKAAVMGDRKVIVFTSYKMVNTEKAKELEKQGAVVIGAGEEGVNGAQMIVALGDMSYQIVKMTTGPAVLKILLDSDVLDRLYITQVQKEIEYDDTSLVMTVLGNGNKVKDMKNFKLTEEYSEESVETDKGQTASQKFFVYDNNKFLIQSKNL
jgi:riboflavin biosynthesis pyrimidine reductase